MAQSRIFYKIAPKFIYAQGEYEITKSYDAYMQQRMNIFRKVTKTKKTLSIAYITSFGQKDNMYSRRVPRQVTGDAFFE